MVNILNFSVCIIVRLLHCLNMTTCKLLVRFTVKLSILYFCLDRNLCILEVHDGRVEREGSFRRVGRLPAILACFFLLFELCFAHARLDCLQSCFSDLSLSGFKLLKVFLFTYLHYVLQNWNFISLRSHLDSFQSPMINETLILKRITVLCAETVNIIALFFSIVHWALSCARRWTSLVSLAGGPI